MHFPFFALVASIRQHKIVSFALDEGGQTLTGSFGKYITFTKARFFLGVYGWRMLKLGFCAMIGQNVLGDTFY